MLRKSIAITLRQDEIVRQPNYTFSIIVSSQQTYLIAAKFTTLGAGHWRGIFKAINTITAPRGLVLGIQVGYITAQKFSNKIGFLESQL